MEFYNDPSKVDENEKMCDDYDGSELYKPKLCIRKAQIHNRLTRSKPCLAGLRPSKSGQVHFYIDYLLLCTYYFLSYCILQDKVIDKHLKNNSTLLELGCGPGNDLVSLQKKIQSHRFRLVG